MRTFLPVPVICALCATMLGCSQTAPTTVATLPDPVLPTTAGLFETQHGTRAEFIGGAWQIHVEAAPLRGWVESGAGVREAQANGDRFALPIHQYFAGEDALTVTGVRINGDLDLELDIEIAHPFPGPNNFEGPASAGNRADLGISGRFFVFAPVPSSFVTDEMAPNHSGDYQFFAGGELFTTNPKFLVNPDGFGNPAALSKKGYDYWMASAGRLHPYIQLVDESDPACRVSTSTGAVIENTNGSSGNYGPDAGWNRSNAGASAASTRTLEWTGYGVLHQGQTSRRTLVLDLDEVAQLTSGGVLTLDTALVAYYTDPRQGENSRQLREHRLPTNSPRDFAYRMPYGAPDVARIYQTGNRILGATIGSTATITLAIVDEDHAAIVDPEFPAPEGGRLQQVPVDSSISSVTLTIPDIDVVDQIGTILSGTGTVDDPLLVSFDITNNTGSDGGFDQINHGFVVVSDHEALSGEERTIWLDPALAPIQEASQKGNCCRGHVIIMK